MVTKTNWLTLCLAVTLILLLTVTGAVSSPIEFGRAQAPEGVSAWTQISVTGLNDGTRAQRGAARWTGHVDWRGIKACFGAPIGDQLAASEPIYDR